MSATYCHCYLVFKCDAAVAEAQGPNGEWTPVCERCQEIAFESGVRVRKLQPSGNGDPDARPGRTLITQNPLPDQPERRTDG